MRLKLYQIDAFADRIFAGNPAAVCPLDEWLADDVMQAIAMENNLSETVFYVPRRNVYEIRWFTPMREVDLCGHATLATAFVIFKHAAPTCNEIVFHSNSGPLKVTRRDEWLYLDFPVWRAERVVMPSALRDAFGVAPKEVWRCEDYLAVMKTEAQVRALEPDMRLLSELDCRGIMVTAPGEDCDFVARFFAPRAGIPEDPVTGSAYCLLTPYWSERLGKQQLTARQLSPRGGKLRCELQGDRVSIAGQAVPFLEGTIELPNL